MITGARLKDEVRALARITGSKRNVNVLFNGGALEASSGDGEINLPAIPSNLILSDLEAKEYRGLSDHESFHHRYTDLKLWAEAAKYCSACNDHISMSVWNGAEDPRIERLGIREYPGTKGNLSKTCDKWMIMLNESAQNHDDPIGFEAVKIAYLGRLNNGFELNLDNFSDLKNQFNQLGSDSEYEKLTTPDDGMELLEGVANFLADKGINTLRNFLDGVPAPEQEDEQEQKQKVSGGEGISNEEKIINPDLGMITQSFECETPYYGAEDRIEYVKLDPCEYEVFMDEMNEFRKYGHGFANALKTTLQTRKDRSKAIGHLNGSRMVDAFNRRDDIWKSKKSSERGHNTALSFVLDCSGSMRNSLGSAIKITKALASGIRSSGIPFEITGFTEWDMIDGATLEIEQESVTREGILRIYEAKGFNENYNPNKINSLSNVELGFTPDSEALELALARIKKRGEKRKVIVILTDGSPQVYKDTVRFNGVEYWAHNVILSHRKAVLEQAKYDGVEVYCIGVGHRDFEHYNPKNVMFASDFSSINHNLFNMFYKAITQAA